MCDSFAILELPMIAMRAIRSCTGKTGKRRKGRVGRRMKSDGHSAVVKVLCDADGALVASCGRFVKL